jgi:hypothetical protein
MDMERGTLYFRMEWGTWTQLGTGFLVEECLGITVLTL